MLSRLKHVGLGLRFLAPIQWRYFIIPIDPANPQAPPKDALHFEAQTAANEAEAEKSIPTAAEGNAGTSREAGSGERGKGGGSGGSKQFVAIAGASVVGIGALIGFLLKRRKKAQQQEIAFQQKIELSQEKNELTQIDEEQPTAIKFKELPEEIKTTPEDKPIPKQESSEKQVDIEESPSPQHSPLEQAPTIDTPKTVDLAESIEEIKKEEGKSEPPSEPLQIVSEEIPKEPEVVIQSSTEDKLLEKDKQVFISRIKEELHEFPKGLSMYIKAEDMPQLSADPENVFGLSGIFEQAEFGKRLESAKEEIMRRLRINEGIYYKDSQELVFFPTMIIVDR
eukprot:TRINITY_DN1224_c0_g6_i1.p1 TRINITY_DN1224_c0_g6~~TRINITY_DN1224_c0_g6_i1.p1  ORF type:complete len:338 (-),score=71.97 TRINITY_DN1224_c0_g6_i1:1004-2017(-)